MAREWPLVRQRLAIVKVWRRPTSPPHLMDAFTNELIWRGWAKETLEGMIGSQDVLERQIDAAVAVMFEGLPAGLVRSPANR